MAQTLLVGLGAFILVFAYLVARRLEIAGLEAARLERAAERIEP
jgi:hypothetical protein